MSSGSCGKDVYPDPAGGSSQDECSNWVDFNLPYKGIDIMREVLKQRVSLVPYMYT